jgi:hypothetical protein
MVAVNQCSSIPAASNIFLTFKKVVHKYLSINILPLGIIPSDSHVAEAVKEQKPFISLFPNAGVSKGIKNIARHLISKEIKDMDEYDIKAFWPRCFDLFKSPLRLTTKKPTDEAVATEEEAITRQKKLARKPEGEISISTDNVERKIPKGQEDNFKEVEQHPESQDIPFLLQNLVKGVTSMSFELGAIRRIIEMDKGHGNKNILSEDIETVM